MADGTSTAVTEATRLNEIGFPEFTAKLINDTFNTLVAANLRQMEAYSELLVATSKTLVEYTSDHQAEIGGQEVWDWLTKNLPGPAASAAANPTEADATLVRVGVTLAADEAAKIQDRTGLAVGADALSQTEHDSVITEVRKKIAGDRYNLLKEMVRMGILRLVVDSGTIETRLTFTTFGRSESLRTASTYDTKSFNISARAQTGSALSKWVQASVAANYSKVSVRTTSAIDRDISGSTVQIYGSVVIRFKTDYQSLA
jgi:hypothetical protein